jgi:BioD-like phosphotransacetylase family protein
MELISRTFIPVISVPEDTFTVASKVNKLIVKVRPGDSEKVRTAEELFEEFVDLDRILEKMA